MVSIQKEFVVNDIPKKTIPLGEFAPGIISALMIISKIQSNVPINQWTFKNEDDEINNILINIKKSSQNYDIEKMAIKLTETNIFTIITSLCQEELILKIKGHGFDDIDMSRFNSRSQCLLTLSRIDINSPWPPSLQQASNIQSDIHGDSIIQLDLCEEVYLCKNYYGDFVVYYYIPIEDGSGYIGYRYTYMTSENSTFNNLIKISKHWTNFLSIPHHNFKGVRLPTFTKQLTNNILSSIKATRFRTGKVISVHADSVFAMNKNGHTINKDEPSLDEKMNSVRVVKNSPEYLNFYESSSMGTPISTNIFTEVLYLDKIGACFNTIPIIQTMINEYDIN